MKGENKKQGFTIVELLTVLAIIALLVGILVPSMNRARFFARNTRQQAQLTAIDMAITLFKNDYGDYPPSGYVPGSGYCGTQKLAEAMVGHDQLGFHPESIWNPQGTDGLQPPKVLYTLAERNNRIGPYLDASKANAFKIQQFFDTPTLPFWGNTTVLCDTFKRLKVSPLPPADPKIKLDAGIPILYFMANANQSTIDMIYNYPDNQAFIEIFKTKINGNGTVDPISTNFYTMIKDPKATSVVGQQWPYRADSYILISAGADGLYGTADDVTNFGN